MDSDEAGPAVSSEPSQRARLARLAWGLNLAGFRQEAGLADSERCQSKTGNRRDVLVVSINKTETEYQCLNQVPQYQFGLLCQHLPVKKSGDSHERNNGNGFREMI